MRCGIKFCKSCKAYSLGEECPKCGKKTQCAHPPKYSFEDKFAKYRRQELYGSA